MTLNLLLTAAVFWHTLAFAAGGVNVWLSYNGLMTSRHDPSWARVIRSAEWQLWVSGVCIIGLGILRADVTTYLNNPKLWTKLIVVSVWLASTVVMRKIAVPRLRRGERTTMLWTCSVSGACWIYGALLGVAKPLANGAAPFPALLAGFGLTVAGCLALTFHLERSRPLARHARSDADQPTKSNSEARNADRPLSASR